MSLPESAGPVPGLPVARELGRQPELALLAALDVSLALVPEVLASVYQVHPATQPTRDQARSLAGLARVMRQQIAAYRGMVALR